MAVMLQVIILCVILSLHHTSYGINGDQEFEPELQNFKSTSSSNLGDNVSNEDSAKPLRTKDNFKNNREIDEKFQPKNVINEDLKKLLRSLVVVLQDLRERSRDNPFDNQFKESSYGKMPITLNSKQREINQSKNRGTYKENNEGKVDIQYSNQGNEENLYSNNVEQMIPPPVSPKFSSTTDFIPNVNQEYGEFVDNYTNNRIISNPRKQTHNISENLRDVQTPVLNSEMYIRNSMDKLTDYKSAGLLATNIQHHRPNEPNPLDFNIKSNTERYADLNRNKNIIGHYKLPSTLYANVKNIQQNKQKPQNFRKETNPVKMSLITESETENFPKKNSEKNGENIINDDRFSIMNSNSQIINPYHSELLRSTKESSTKNMKDEEEIYRSKPTDELNINRKIFKSNEHKQVNSNEDLITGYKPNDDWNKTINNYELSNTTNSNLQNGNSKQLIFSSFSNESRMKNEIKKNEINLPQPTDEINLTTKNFEANEEKQMNSKRFIFKDHQQDSGKKENYNNEPFRTWSEENFNPNQPKFFIESTAKDGQNTDKNKDETSIPKPNSSQSNEGKKPKHTISNGELGTEEKTKYKENKVNKNEDEPSNVLNADSKNIYSNQPKKTKLKNKKLKTQNDDKFEDDFKSFEPTNDFNKNAKNNDPVEPKQADLNGESNTGIFSKVGKNEDYGDNTKPTNIEKDSSKNVQFNPPKQNGLNKESETKDYSYEDSSIVAINNNEITNVADTAPRNIHSNMFKQMFEESKENNYQTIFEIPKNASENVSNTDSKYGTKDLENEERNNDESYERKTDEEEEQAFTNFSNYEDDISANSMQLQSFSNVLYENNGSNFERSPNFENQSQTVEPTALVVKFDSSQFLPKSAHFEQEVDKKTDESYKDDKTEEDDNQDKNDYQGENENQDDDDNKDENKNHYENQNEDKNQNKDDNQYEDNNENKNENKDDDDNKDENKNEGNKDDKTEEEDDNQDKNDYQSENENKDDDDNKDENQNENEDDNQYEDKNENQDENQNENRDENQAEDDSKEEDDNQDKYQDKNDYQGENENEDDDDNEDENQNQNEDDNQYEDKNENQYENQNENRDENQAEDDSKDEDDNQDKYQDKNDYQGENKNQDDDDSQDKDDYKEDKENQHNDRNQDEDDNKDDNKNQYGNQNKDDSQYEDDNKDEKENQDENQNQNQNQDENQNQNQDENQNQDDSKYEDDNQDDNQDTKNIPNRNQDEPKDVTKMNQDEPKDISKINQDAPSESKDLKNHYEPKDFQHFEDVYGDNSLQPQNLPSLNVKNSTKVKITIPFENESQLNESTTTVENLDSAQTAFNVPVTETILNDRDPSLHLQNLQTPNVKNPVKDEISPPFESESQISESTTPKNNVDSSQTAPNGIYSEAFLNENSQQYQNLPTSYEINPIKDEKLPTFKNESKANDSKTPSKKNYQKQTVSNFPDFEEEIIRNSQEFQNLPPQINNKKIETFSSFKQSSQVNEQKTPRDKNGFEQAVETVPNFPNFKDTIRKDAQQHQNLASSYGNSSYEDKTSLTSKKEGQINESTASGEKFDTIVEFLQRYSKNLPFKEQATK